LSNCLGISMYSSNQFAKLEIMCRERAALAKKEMEYWLTEAEEWKQLRKSPAPFVDGVPIQSDLCSESNNY
jgi:hypothetical protein